MSTETSKKAPVSAEPIAYKVPSGTAFAMGISRYQDASCFGGNKTELHAAAKKHEWKPLYAAPVAAQPPGVDMVPPATSRDRWMYQQGRLAERDPRTPGSLAAEIAAQAQQMEPICYVKPAATIATLNGYTVCPEGEGIPVYARAQQPVSGADGLPDDDDLTVAYMSGVYDGKKSKPPTSGNSGELPSDVWLAGCVGVQNQGGLRQITGLADIRRFAECVLKHWGKQDADKVDAERYRTWRDASLKQDDEFLDGMLDLLPRDPKQCTAEQFDAAIDAARKEQA